MVLLGKQQIVRVGSNAPYQQYELGCVLPEDLR